MFNNFMINPDTTKIITIFMIIIYVLSSLIIFFINKKIWKINIIVLGIIMIILQLLMWIPENNYFKYKINKNLNPKIENIQKNISKLKSDRHNIYLKMKESKSNSSKYHQYQIDYYKNTDALNNANDNLNQLKQKKNNLDYED